MSSKPLFVATHPRACSTAFERVFMTRRDILSCIHEPFGDAFYYGPERLSDRFEKDEAARLKSGFANTTYKDILDGIDAKAPEGKRIFIKDMAYYLIPPNGAPAKVPASLQEASSPRANGTQHGGPDVKGVGKTNGDAHHNDGNPTIMPTHVLGQFHFAFLIRHPRRAIPSYYRCTVPPLDAVTGFDHFMPSEAGYVELRLLFDFLRREGMIGDEQKGMRITVVDADDLLDRPEQVIRAFCGEVGVDFSPDMLRWDDEGARAHAKEAFEKWNGFHDDAIGSTSLRPRENGVKSLTTEEEDEQWRQKFGDEAQRVIRECVDANVADYEYLKSFAIKA